MGLRSTNLLHLGDGMMEFQLAFSLTLLVHSYIYLVHGLLNNILIRRYNTTVLKKSVCNPVPAV